MDQQTPSDQTARETREAFERIRSAPRLRYGRRRYKPNQGEADLSNQSPKKTGESA